MIVLPTCLSPIGQVEHDTAASAGPKVEALAAAKPNKLDSSEHLAVVSPDLLKRVLLAVRTVCNAFIGKHLFYICIFLDRGLV